MIDTSSKQPLLLQLLQERRRFAEQAVQLYSDKGINAALLRECELEEQRRRAQGMRALPLTKILAKRGILTEKEAETATRAARSNQEPFLSAKDAEALRNSGVRLRIVQPAGPRAQRQFSP